MITHPLSFRSPRASSKLQTNGVTEKRETEGPQGHPKASAELSFPIENGPHIFPGDITEAASSVAESGEPAMRSFWKERKSGFEE